MSDRTELILNTLGMARRAGVLFVGQDHVFAEMRKHVQLLAVTSNDCSSTVVRSLKAGEERGELRIIMLESVDRTALGGRVGVASAQVTALLVGSGFAKKVLSLYDRSDADE